MIGEYTLDEVGAYQIVMTVGGAEKVYNVYSVLPEAERTPVQTAERVEIVGEASGSGLNGIYDIVIFLFALLAVVFIADWGVYCYDKYQLR